MNLIPVFEEFCRTFRPLLTTDKYYFKKNDCRFNRWPAFEFIANELFLKKRPLTIVETGTLRKSNDWLGYGHSLLLWDWIIKKTDGIAYSVDIDYDAIKFARSATNKCKLINCDSIGFLRGFKDADKIDLLYLDSFDWEPALHISSCLHHLAELGSIWDRLPSDCLIAVDDRHTDDQGKHVLVDLFFSKIVKIEPLIKCHVIVWRKP